MPKIQRTGRAKFERIARGRNMIHVQLRAAINQLLHRRRLKLAQASRITLDACEKLFVTDKGDFYRLDIPGAFVTRRERRKQLKIVNDSKWRRECTDEILFTESIDPVLHSHAGICL